MSKFFSVFLLLVIQQVFAQLPGVDPVKADDLAATTYEGDASAPAAILYSRCQQQISHLSASRTTDFRFRIKIYSTEGFEYATQLIPNPSRNFTLKSAATYNLVNGAVQRIPLLEENIFEEEITNGMLIKRLVFPNVQVGSIIELHYTTSTAVFYHIPNWDFQHKIPVKYSELVTIIPQFFTFSTTFRGQQEIESSTLNIYHPEYTDVQYTYISRNLPALKKAAFVNSMHNYTTSVQHELKMLTMPNFNSVLIANSWDKVIKNIFKKDDFSKELEKDSYFKDDLKAVLNGLTTPEEKLNTVFAYVQNRMLWNKRCSVYCNKGVKDAYKNKSGNCAEINLMLVAMLRHAGLEAYPVLECLRSSRIEIFPSYDAFDYLTCVAKIDGKNILLDATSKWSKPGVLPLRAINWEGYMVKQDGSFDIIDVIPQSASLKSTVIAARLDAGGNCTGNLRTTYTDHLATAFREKESEKAGKDDYLGRLEKEYEGIAITDYKVNALTDATKPLSEEFVFNSSGAAEVIGGHMYLSPLLFFSKAKNPFDEKERQYPIDFGFPEQRRFLFTLMVPDGYTVASVPGPVSYKITDDIATFSYNVQQADDKIQLMVSVAYNKAVVDAGHYTSLHDFYDKVIDKLKEKIVLKKN